MFLHQKWLIWQTRSWHSASTNCSTFISEVHTWFTWMTTAIVARMYLVSLHSVTLVELSQRKLLFSYFINITWKFFLSISESTKIQSSIPPRPQMEHLCCKSPEESHAITEEASTQVGRTRCLRVPPCYPWNCSITFYLLGKYPHIVINMFSIRVARSVSFNTDCPLANRHHLSWGIAWSGRHPSMPWAQHLVFAFNVPLVHNSCI